MTSRQVSLSILEIKRKSELFGYSSMNLIVEAVLGRSIERSTSVGSTSQKTKIDRSFVFPYDNESFVKVLVYNRDDLLGMGDLSLWSNRTDEIVLPLFDFNKKGTGELKVKVSVSGGPISDIELISQLPFEEEKPVRNPIRNWIRRRSRSKPQKRAQPQSPPDFKSPPGPNSHLDRPRAQVPENWIVTPSESGFFDSVDLSGFR